MVTEKEKRKAEEDYFSRVEFERRQKAIRDKQDHIEAKEKERLKALHWMRCPKCGMEMIEIDFEGVRVDKCSSCLGIYFDDGEVEQLAQKTAPGFVRRLSDLFKG